MTTRSRSLAVALILVTGACVTARSASWQYDETGFQDVSEAIMIGLVRDGDEAYAERDRVSRLDEAIAAYTAALRQRPSDASFILKLGRAYLARGRLRTKKEAFEDLDKAISCAEKALGLMNQECRARANAKKTESEIFAAATVNEMPVMALYTEALFVWAEENSHATLMAESARLDAASRRMIELDRSFAYGAPERLYGALLSERSGFRAAARLHLEAALANAPDYLQNKLDYAKRYLQRARDIPRSRRRQRYRQALSEIISANASRLANVVIENRAAQKAAAQLLAQAR